MYSGLAPSPIQPSLVLDPFGSDWIRTPSPSVPEIWIGADIADALPANASVQLSVATIVRLRSQH
jgi:hypothetical protein